MKFLATAAGFALLAGTASAETKEDCIARWEAATAAGIVYGVSEEGGVPSGIIDEDAFKAADFHTKAGFMQTLICAVVGPDNTLGEAQLLSNKTNKRLARWRIGKGFTVD